MPREREAGQDVVCFQVELEGYTLMQFTNRESEFGNQCGMLQQVLLLICCWQVLQLRVQVSEVSFSIAVQHQSKEFVQVFLLGGINFHLMHGQTVCRYTCCDTAQVCNTRISRPQAAFNQHTTRGQILDLVRKFSALHTD